MEYLILFNGTDYYINNRYMFDKNTNQVYSIYWSKYLRNFRSNSKKSQQTYISINSILYNFTKVIEWNTANLDTSTMKIIGNIEKICRKCKQENKLFAAKKILICNDCMIKTKPKHIQQQIKNNDDFIIVDKFLHKLKSKNWMATDLDLFSLIDVYERYFPNMILSTPLDEDHASRILFRILRHHNKIKSDAIKDTLK